MTSDSIKYCIFSGCQVLTPQFHSRINFLIRRRSTDTSTGKSPAPDNSIDGAGESLAEMISILQIGCLRTSWIRHARTIQIKIVLKVDFNILYKNC